jgi:hypothetical protein
VKSDNSDRLDRLEQRFAEMQRRTMANLTVTNPADGQTYLRVSGAPQLYDSTGASILLAASSGSWGYSNPWQNYVMFPVEPPGGYAIAGGFVDSHVATLYPNQPRIYITAKALLTNIDPSAEPTGAIADWQTVYSVDGVGSTPIPGLSGTTSTPEVSVVQSVTYLWPADYFNHRIQIRFQARIRSGTGNGDDYTRLSPTRVYGGPQ